MIVGAATLIVFSFATQCVPTPGAPPVPGVTTMTLAWRPDRPGVSITATDTNGISPAFNAGEWSERRVGNTEVLTQALTPTITESITLDLRRNVILAATPYPPCTITDPLPITPLRASPSK